MYNEMCNSALRMRARQNLDHNTIIWSDVSVILFESGSFLP